MTTCQEVRDGLSAYLDQELTADERAELAEHLEGCRDCQEQRDALQRTMASLAATFQASIAAAPPVPSLPLSRRRPLLWNTALAVAAAIVLFVALRASWPTDDGARQVAEEVAGKLLEAGFVDLWMACEDGRGLRVHYAGPDRFVAQFTATDSMPFQKELPVFGADGERLWRYDPERLEVVTMALGSEPITWNPSRDERLQQLLGANDPAMSDALVVLHWLMSDWTRELAEGQHPTRDLTPDAEPGGPRRIEVVNSRPDRGDALHDWSTATLEVEHGVQGDTLTWVQVRLDREGVRTVGLSLLRQDASPPELLLFQTYIPPGVEVHEYEEEPMVLDDHTLEALRELGYTSSDDR